jgi:uncharacterized protein YqgQ
MDKENCREPLNFETFNPPFTRHKKFTEEEYKQDLEKKEIDAIYMMRFDLQRLRYHGVLSERQYKKASKNLRKQAAKLGIYFY